MADTKPSTLNACSRNPELIHVYYRGDYLDFFRSGEQTRLYQAKITSQTPQLTLVSMDPAANSVGESPSGLTTAAFKKLSLSVSLVLHGNPVTMTRPQNFTRSYEFTSPSVRRRLRWEPDGALTGNFRLIDATDPAQNVLARFINTLFSTAEVGSFEVIEPVSWRTRDEILVTGLAELVMMQSLQLAGMVLFG